MMIEKHKFYDCFGASNVPRNSSRNLLNSGKINCHPRLDVNEGVNLRRLGAETGAFLCNDLFFELAEERLRRLQHLAGF
jgi:hypothetical protein